uniref:Selenoprotein N n=1 Tax=Ictidomys tridecemlineatus TaxID=43179 RepID=A0A287D6Q8_ICTTR
MGRKAPGGRHLERDGGAQGCGKGRQERTVARTGWNGAYNWGSAQCLPPQQESALKALGTEGLFLFSSLDTDGDMYISPEEFKPIAEKLTGSTPAASYEEEELIPDPTEETLTIEARFQPLLPETMTKSKDGFLGVSRDTGAESVPHRIHAEFQLSEPPDFPFWFSPGQFTGHIILSKDATHVRDFRLFVPNHRSLNVDMEWLYGASEGSSMEVDIGYVPQMELEAMGPSVPSVILDEDGNVIDSRQPSGEPLQFVFEEIRWQQELSWEEAARHLEVAMYPFKKVTYLPFTEAFDRAKAENKLVHSILLWGALDDQSCSGRTLRETVLESSPILALLNESFISTWSLVKELEDLQSNQENPSHRQLAGLHLEKYSFPVEMMICLPNGTVVHHINANYFLDITSMKPEDVENNVFSFSSTFEDPSTATYMQFLKEGLRRGLPHLHP